MRLNTAIEAQNKVVAAGVEGLMARQRTGQREYAPIRNRADNAAVTKDELAT